MLISQNNDVLSRNRFLFFKIQKSFYLFCIYFGCLSFVVSRWLLCCVPLSLITQIASTCSSTCGSSVSDHPVLCASATAAKLTSAYYFRHKIPEDNGFPLMLHIKYKVAFNANLEKWRVGLEAQRSITTTVRGSGHAPVHLILNGKSRFSRMNKRSQKHEGKIGENVVTSLKNFKLTTKILGCTRTDWLTKFEMTRFSGKDKDAWNPEKGHCFCPQTLACRTDCTCKWRPCDVNFECQGHFCFCSTR